MKNKKISYGKHYIDKNDIFAVNKVLKSNFLTTGPLNKIFEKKFKQYVKSKYAISCNSGTSALFLVLKAIDIKKDDIVILPSFSFVAAANMCSFLGAKVYFSDINPDSGLSLSENIEDCIKKNKIKSVKAFFTMNFGGYGYELSKFSKIKKNFNCYWIEDSCHALGGYNFINRKNFKVGSCKLSDFSTFSFHPVKSITTAEGGMITTNSSSFNKKIRLLRSHGIIRKSKSYWKYDVKSLGFNFRLSDINSSLGISQLSKLDQFIKKRRNIAKYYLKKIILDKNVLSFPKFNVQYSSHHLFIILINFKKMKLSRDKFIKKLNKKNIFPQIHYVPSHKFTFYKKIKYNNYLKNTEYFSQNCVSLPIYCDLKKNDLIYIVKELNSLILHYKKNKP